MMRPSTRRILAMIMQTPVQLLRDMYEQRRVLILGFPYHMWSTQYQMLDSLLQVIGHDPRLKFIVLERPKEDAPVLEAASTAPLQVPDEEQWQFKNAGEYISVPCNDTL